MTFTRCQFLFVEGALTDNYVGITKEVDKLGRIVIPKEFRERLSLTETVELILTDKGVLVRNPEYELVKSEKNEKNRD